MKHTLTKAQIIKALKTEPLREGWWHWNTPATANATCEVCAVGAILRQLKWNFHEEEANNLASRVHGTHRLLQDLSIEFETVAGHEGTEVARKAAIAYVRKNFPAKLEIEID